MITAMMATSRISWILNPICEPSGSAKNMSNAFIAYILNIDSKQSGPKPRLILSGVVSLRPHLAHLPL